MTSTNYDEIYSGMFTRMQEYDFLTMPKDMVMEYLSSWMHSVSAKPYIRRAFTSISLDDETQKLTWELKRPIDNETDSDFVRELFSLGLCTRWLEREKNRSTLTRQMYGSTKHKFYSQSNHLMALQQLYSDMNKELQQLIGDKNSSQNSYINEYGES